MRQTILVTVILFTIIGILYPRHVFHFHKRADRDSIGKLFHDLWNGNVAELNGIEWIMYAASVAMSCFVVWYLW